MSELNDKLLDENNIYSKYNKYKPYLLVLTIITIIGFIIELVFISIKFFSTD